MGFEDARGDDVRTGMYQSAESCEVEADLEPFDARHTVGPDRGVVRATLTFGLNRIGSNRERELTGYEVEVHSRV
jgi:hypothetical protein